MGGGAFGARGDVSTFETPLAASPTISNRRTSHSNVQRIEAVLTSCCFVFSAQTSRLKRELCSAGILPDVIIRQPQMDDCHCVTLSYTTPSPHCWKSMCLPEWKVMVGVGMFSQSSDWHNRKLAKQDLSPQRRWSQVGGEAFLLWHRGSDTNTEAPAWKRQAQNVRQSHKSESSFIVGLNNTKSICSHPPPFEKIFASKPKIYNLHSSASLLVFISYE